MSSMDDRPDDTAARRRQAEDIATREQVARLPEVPETLSHEEALQVLHELRIHQIELEMQNEELHRTQAELENSRARYFDLYDLAPVGYFSLSEKGMILEANLTAATLLGVTRDSLVKQPLSRFILPEDQDIYYRHRRQFQETGKPKTCELRMVRSDSTQFWVRFVTTITRDFDGNRMDRTVMTEITEQKHLEAEKEILEAKNRQLQKAESLGCMAGAIAHHFNNQLTAVLGNLELAMITLSQGMLPHENVRAAMKASRLAAEVSSLMLTYLGQTFVKRETLDLSESCRQTLRTLRTAIPRNVSVTMDLPIPGLVIKANAIEMKQILTNLLTNAWEAIGEGQGAIHLTLGIVSPAEIPIVHRFPVDWQPQNHNYACLEVADKGSGIADMDIEKIFDPFFSSKFTGRGLGAAVILGIVRAYGGAVTVESKLGLGSTFRIFFPVPYEEIHLQQLKVERAETADKSLKRDRGGKVLLVEDEEAVRITTAAMLTRLGYTVVKASDGVEALAVFGQHRNEISFVLCDLTMPRMDGWETLTALRKLAPGIPVILTSGYNEVQVMAGDHPEQPQVFLNKPYTLNDLDNAINRSAL
ncbi:PAS domain S-box-containing protein [Syntrophus gentianae]|uniref:histidine kinase n=1 Tax=Syntrophus gentianae TaxID=43775 RepID=A0A1H7XSI5_9BACT|nr:response regulator [Syntrophus gentianae]SEM36902.1 PAS domain S-box-containing protein [Syntrophus gentianae]